MNQYIIAGYDGYDSNYLAGVLFAPSARIACDIANCMLDKEYTYSAYRLDLLYNDRSELGHYFLNDGSYADE